MIPFHCDALLPEAERYSSLKFRRCAQKFEGDQFDALELGAFLGVVPLKWARWIFHWPKRYRLPLIVWAPPEYIQANRDAMDVETGLAVLAAMRDGGWVRGKVPDVVQMAIKELAHGGLSHSKIGERVGLTVDQVQYLVSGRPSGEGGRERVLAGIGLSVAG